MVNEEFLVFNEGKHLSIWYNNVAKYTTENEVLVSGKWIHYLIAIDQDGNIYLYVNGELENLQ